MARLFTESVSRFVRRGSEQNTHETPDRGSITGPMMAQYLLALLSLQRHGGMGPGGGTGVDPLSELLGRTSTDGTHGRWGDYVFNQEGEDSRFINVIDISHFMSALDRIITQIMENSNSGRPVPATDEIIENLPREVLEEGCTEVVTFLSSTFD